MEGETGMNAIEKQNKQLYDILWVLYNLERVITYSTWKFSLLWTVY